MLCLKKVFIPCNCLKFAAIACLNLSLKQHLPLEQLPTIEQLCVSILSKDEKAKIRDQTVVQMELLLSSKLGWDLIVPTPYEVSRKLLACATDLQEEGCRELLDSSSKLARRFLGNIESTATSPSLRGIVATILAVEVHTNSDPFAMKRILKGVRTVLNDSLLEDDIAVMREFVLESCLSSLPILASLQAKSPFKRYLDTAMVRGSFGLST